MSESAQEHSSWQQRSLAIIVHAPIILVLLGLSLASFYGGLTLFPRLGLGACFSALLYFQLRCVIGVARGNVPAWGTRTYTILVLDLIGLALIGASWTLWERMFIEASRQRAFNKRFPELSELQTMSASSKAGLAQRLIGALDDPDPEVRRRAGFAIARVGPPASAAIPKLIQIVDSGDFRIKVGAVEALEGISAGLNSPFSGYQTDAGLAWRAREALIVLGSSQTLQSASHYPCPEDFRSRDWCK